MLLKRKVKLGSRTVFAVAVACQIVVFGLVLPSHSQDFDAQCEGLKTKWERTVQDLNAKLQEYEEIRRCPLEKVVKRPLVDFSSGKTIAKQISDAIQAKDSLLASKRKLCQDVLTTEGQAYNELVQCVRAKGNDKQARVLKKIEKNRKQVVEKAKLAIVAVREVEGHDTTGYSQAYQSGYGRDNGYWQQYQQMYRGYWGR
jgi:hypothetical protein